MNCRNWICSGIAAGIASATALFAGPLYENDFEALGKLIFRGSFGPRWIGDLKTAEREGHVKVHRMGLSEQGEKSHSGVMSYVLDVTVDKSTGKWGGTCMFQSPALRIPLNRPVYLTGYVYPEILPPDILLSIGVIFEFPDPKTGKKSGGSLRLTRRGVDPEGWMVFSEDVTKLVTGRFPGAVMTGWMIDIHSNRAFHGQRVKLFLDDVSVTETPASVNVTKDGVVRGHDILSRNPYEVNYLSYYREVPETALNRAFNSSFELGMKDWFPMVQRSAENDRSGKEVELPDPESVFRIVSSPDAPHGGKVLKVERNGRKNYVTLRSLPLQIQDGKDYVLSFYAWASKPTLLRVNFRHVNLSGGWKRYVLPLPRIACYQTWNGKKFPGRFELNFTNADDADLQFDAIQFQRAPLTEYRGHGIVQFAAKPRNRYGLYLPGSTPEFEVALFNDASEKRRSVLRWEMKNYRRDVIAKGEKTVELNAGSGDSFRISAPAGLRHCTLSAVLEAPGQKTQTCTVSASVIDDLKQLKGNEFFGGCPIEGDNPPNLLDILELNKRLGMSFNVNYHTGYQSRAPKEWRKENPQWQMIENVVNFNRRYGFETLLTNYAPFPAGTKVDAEGGEIVTPEIERDVYEYHRELASRFKGKIRCFETFAEYLKSPLKQKAAAADRIIRAAYRGIKEGNPDAVFCALGENKMDQGMLLTKMEELFRHGTLDYMDFISLHPYELGDRAVSHETLRKFAELIRKYNRGKDKKIYGTEGGRGATDSLYYDDINAESLFYDRYVTELQQAEYIVRSNILMFGSGMFVRNAIFYPYNGKVSSRNSMYHFVIADNGIYPKTVFPATANMIGRLSGSVPEGEFEQRDANGLQGYYFRKNGGLFAALWIYRPDHRTRDAVLPLPSDRIQAYNLVGEPIRLRGGAKTLLTLSEGPLYLYPKNIPDAEFIAALKSIKVENPSVSLRVGKNGVLTAEIFNDTSSELNGTLALAPSGEKRAFRIPSGGRRSFDFPWTNRTSLTAYQAEIQVGGERIRSNEIRPLFCGKAERRPRIDGNPEEFRHLPGIRLGAAQHVSLYQAKIRNSADLDAVVRFLYDDSFFYIAAEVTDDLHRIPHEQPNMYWANDALQLLFVMSGKRENLSARDLLELAVSDTKQGARISTTLLEQKLDFSRAEVAVTRRNGTTFYELALPWEILCKGFRPDNSVNPGFNLAVSDNDGNLEISRMPKLKGYEKSLQMSRGLVDSKDPSFALTLFFEQK